MRTHSKILLALGVTGLLLSGPANADSWEAPHDGFLIQLSTPNGIAQKSGQTAQINGTITWVGGHLPAGQKGWGDRGHDSDVLTDLLQRDGLQIHAYFPDATTDVTSQVQLAPSRNGITVQYTTPALQTQVPSALTLVVTREDPEVFALQKVEAKLNVRIAALQAAVAKLTAQGDSAQDIAWLQTQVTELQAVSARINAKILAGNEVLAQEVFPLQVDNIVAAASMNSSLIEPFRFTVSYDLGSAIEGESTTAHGIIARDSDDGDPNGLGSGYWIPRFFWNGTQVKQMTAQKITSGSQVEFDFPVSNLDPSQQNTFAESLTRSDHDDGGHWDWDRWWEQGNFWNNQSGGMLAYQLPVAVDNVPPTWLASSTPSQNVCMNAMQPINMTAVDTFGLVDPDSVQATLTGTQTSGTTVNQDVTPQITAATPDQGQTYDFTGNLNPIPDGLYNFSIASTDLAGNATTPNPYTAQFRVDSVPPTLTLGPLAQIYTNAPYTNIANLAFTATTVDYYDLCSIETTATDGSTVLGSSATGTLSVSTHLQDGVHEIVVSAVNNSDGLTSSAQSFPIIVDTVPPVLSNISPAPNSTLNTLTFALSGSANEPLLYAKVNGQSLTLSPDKTSFSGSYTAQTSGPLTLHYEVADLATNVTTADVPVTLVLTVLNKSLVSIVPDKTNANEVDIIGAAGAAAPGQVVEFSTGQSVVANADGSFDLVVPVFTTGTLTVSDAATSMTGTDTLSFGSANGTLLSGSVKDTSGNPLPGVTVSFQGLSSVQPVVTDANGVFSFQQPATGDQVLIFDGTSVPQSITNGKEQYSVVHVAINVGIGQSNVLQTPVYLSPLDTATATQIPTSGTVEVTDSNAPGVSLSFDASTVTFPKSNISSISMSRIPAKYSTIPPLPFASPGHLIALEPSGLTFSSPAQITLPNDNNLPAGLDVVIMSMNSGKGIWEIGGVGTVSADGSSIVTKPGMGITHFSEVYATPLGPKVAQIGAQDKPGADTFNGALSTQVNLPSYRSLGSMVTPSLVYKSAWAKPTALISNLINIPQENISYNYVYQAMAFTAVVNGTENYVPDYISAQFFTNGLASSVLKFTGVPNNSVVSYATDLKDPTSSAYFPSGVYPYDAHYEIHLDDLIVGTQTTTENPAYGPEISQASFYQNIPIQQAFPQDLTGPLYVQNKVNSPAGRGWKISGVQKILNPQANRILLEESDGTIAGYSLNNSITTIADGAVSGFDLKYGSDLTTWPVLTVSGTNSDQTRNLSSLDLSQNPPVLTDLGTVSFPDGTMNLVAGNASWSSPPCYDHIYTMYVQNNPQQLVRLPDGSLVGTNYKPSDGSRFSWDLSFIFSLKDGAVTFSPTFRTGKDSPTGGGNFQAEAPIGTNDVGFFNTPLFGFSNFETWAAYYEGTGLTLVSGTEQSVSPYVDSSSESCSYDDQTFAFPLSGYSDFDFAYQAAIFNHPMGITLSPSGEIIVADSGNNLVRAWDPKTRMAHTIAGTGANYDNGDGGPATSASLFHPQGVVYDSLGNLYISTGNGYIRKVDSTGIISTFAGLPSSQGGVLADTTPASKALLNNPFGMVVDNNNGYLYVADTGNNRVVRIDFLTQMAVSVAGSGVSGYNGDDQPALSAELAAPTLLGLDSQQNLLIADSGNNRIRRVVFQSDTTGPLAFAPIANDNTSLVRNGDGSWTRTYRNGLVISFDSTGREVSAQDRAGRVSSFAYDALGRIVSMTDPTGQAVQYFYSGNNLSWIRDPAGRVTSFAYDGEGDLITVSFPDGSKKTYTYDPTGLMLSETDQRGMTTQYSYNQWNRLSNVIRADGSTISVNDSGSATAMNNFTGGTMGTLQSYGNNSGQVYDGITDARSIQTQFIKDSAGYISTLIDGAGHTTQVQRDSFGNPTLITRPDGTTESFTYDPNTHDLLSETDSGTGITTSQTFDSYGNLLTKTNGRGFTSSNQYNPNTGLLVAALDPLGQGISYTYNGLGMATSIKDSLGIGTSTTYDSRGNPLTVTDTANHETTYTYDSAGNALTMTDANQHLTKYSYDAFNRLITVTSPKGETTTYSYLPTGQLESVTDPQGNITLYAYNQLGEMVQETDPLGNVLKRSYDGDGNVIQEIDPNQNTKTYVYNDLNQLVQKQLPDNQVNFTYDVRGNTISASNLQSAINYGYDDGERLTSVTTAGLGSAASVPSVVLSFTYNGDNNRATMSGPRGITSYSYDNADRLISITNPEGETYSFGFDPGNRLTSISRPGSSTQIGFDNADFVNSIVHSSGGVTLASFNYARDNVGGITSIQTGAGISRSMTYDSDEHLASATNPEAPQTLMQGESYNYDAISNRTQDEGGAYTYDNHSQRLVKDYRYTYVYDNNGNLSSRIEVGNGVGTDGFIGETTNYFYSSENQLVGIKVYPQGSSSPSKEITYAYDALGRRIQRNVIDHTAETDPRKTFTYDFVYDGQSVLLQYDGNGNLFARFTQSGLALDDVLAADVTSEGVSGGLASNASTYQYLKDQQGTITDVTDNSGKKVQHYIYSAFGMLLGIQDAQANDVTSNPPLNTSFGFTGRELDSESGLMYYRARMYDPASGRFIQKDPLPGKIKNPQTLVNRYAYAGNSPLEYVDPTGRSFWSEVNWGQVGSVAAITVAAVVFGPEVLVPLLVVGGLGAVLTGATTHDWSFGNLANAALLTAGTAAAIALGGYGAGSLAALSGSAPLTIAAGAAGGAATSVGITAAHRGGFSNMTAEDWTLSIATGAIGGTLAGYGAAASAGLEGAEAQIPPSLPVGNGGTGPQDEYESDSPPAWMLDNSGSTIPFLQ